MGLFKKFSDKLSETPEQLEAQEIRNWCGDLRGVTQLAACRPRERTSVAGIVETIKVMPGDYAPRLEVGIYDGTDRMIGIWFGRNRIHGVELGQRLILKGTVAFLDKQLKIINPEYELVAAEEE